MLDELDQTLLALLRENARRSYRKLAKRSGSTVPTVSARIKRMEDIGIIGGYTVVETGKSAPAGGVAVECHQCHKATSDPVIKRLDNKLHPFCCTTCESVYVEKYGRLKQGL